MVDRTLSHYRILDRLGAGAMGEVYLAEDVRLGRKVALKLLPAHLTRDEAAKTRLIHEARAASLLDHPHICTVYDIEELPTSELLLAMAYCDGETLRTRLSRGPLPVDEAVELACQMADALAEAHAHGIVHRDIKPANAMVTRTGRLKLVDFGLAHLPEATMLTATGVTVGTPAYMAPEQVRGEEVDARADLWALGVVLYEMLAGRPPFGKDSLEAVLYAVVHQAPEPLDRVRPGLPPSLVRIVNRALAKDGRARYQQAEQMLADLRACRERLKTNAPQAAGAEAPRVPSIAVLPFANLSPDPEQEYFCDGMTEELITALGAIEGLRVAAKTSTFHLKGKDLEIRTIGERLNVETLLEGSVRKAGNRLRVTAQLVNVSDGYHLWSERYDRQLDDVFAVQDQIARAIVEKLKVKLVGPKEAPLVKRASSNLEAYQLYLKGRYYFARRYRGGLERAMDCFAQAVGLDPDLAPALAGLADGYSVAGFWGLSLPRELLPKAREAAERAVALDDALAEAHLAKAMVHTYLDWDWEAMEREFTRALALDPNAPLTHAYYGLSLAVIERTGDAEREAEQAMMLDPLSALVFFLAAGAHNTLGQWGRAIDISQQALSLDPGFLPASWILGLALSDTGRHEEAIETAERGVRLTDRVPFFVSALGRVLARAGRRDAAREVLAELLERSARESVSPLWVAMIHDGLGEVAEGIGVLERGIPDWGQAYVLPLASRTVSALQSHPRLWEILKGLGYTSPRASPPAPATSDG
jgi:eukaryotic-like serine/threonine-protein kinase